MPPVDWWAVAGSMRVFMTAEDEDDAVRGATVSGDSSLPSPA
jgi:hypothetical protein